jgi:hypothetical protein
VAECDVVDVDENLVATLTVPHLPADPRLAAAIVDRITFNAHILETGHDSYRLRTTPGLIQPVTIGDQRIGQRAQVQQHGRLRPRPQRALHHRRVGSCVATGRAQLIGELQVGNIGFLAPRTAS